jgi:hypothetical protein
MEKQGWYWAQLNASQLNMLQEAERTLGSGTEVLLALTGTRTEAGLPEVAENGLKVAPLDNSQVECLQGLEKKLGALVIAYQHAGRQ